MSSNKHARERLEKLFGKICFIEELGIRNIPKDQRRKIKGYTRYDDVLTYHHIQEKAKGGPTTDDNGALVRGYNHRWLHSLPEDQKQKINNCMLEFKAAVIHHNGERLEAEPLGSFELSLDFNPEDCIEIPAFDTTKEDLAKREKFNRAKTKREFQKQVDEDLYFYNNPDERDEDDHRWDWDR